jgi:GTPase SAR1 family protein
MKRTTAGVNLFRISQAVEGNEDPGEQNHTKQKVLDKQDTISENKMDWSVVTDGQPAKSAKSIHTEISSDNRTLRSSTKVVENVFDIQVDDTICKMRKDTRLVLIDVPGINEADSSRKFKDYVKSHWTTFDCVCLVMDAVQGVNTEEQVELLKFVKKNNEEDKDIPTIILGNKMDDPEHKQKLELVRETRQKTIEIFGETCSEDFLARILDAESKDVDDVGLRSGAVFVPVSAAYAFVYRKAGSLTVESLQKLDKDILDDIGQMEVGIKRWRKLSDSKKCQVVRDAISDPSEYHESLARTNFHNFLSVLAYYVGGDDAQCGLLAKQIDVVLRFLAPNESGSLADAIHYVYKRCQAVGRSTDDLPTNFWRVYASLKEDAMEKASEEVDSSGLLLLFAELQAYYELATTLGWDFEQDKATKEMKSLLQNQLSLVLDKKTKWSFDTFQSQIYVLESKKLFCGGDNNEICNRRGYESSGCGGHHAFDGQQYYHCGQQCNVKTWKKPIKVDWTNLSPHDWIVLLSSILLPSNEVEFYKHFGQEKTNLEAILLKMRMRYDSELFSVEKGLDLSNEKQYVEAVRRDEANPEGSKNDAFLLKVEMPSELSDPSHWGCIGWKYTEFYRSLSK